MKTIDQTIIKNKAILLIVDYNIKDDNTFKITQSLPTVRFILDGNPRTLFILTHLGRPKDREEYSTIPILRLLKNIDILKDIEYMPLNKYMESTVPGGLFFGDNSRYYDDLRDFYGRFDSIVYDAFGTIHRKNEFKGYAGLLLQREVEVLDSVGDCDLLIMGGAKISEKIRLMERFDMRIFLGGGLCTSVYKKMGYEIGDRTISEDVSCMVKKEGIVLPVDFKVLREDGTYENKEIGEILKTDTIIDIGEESIRMVKEMIDESKFILWNGPLGHFEDEEATSTKEIVEKLEEGRDRRKVVAGGGETVNAIVKFGNTDNFYHVSTGGGAMLSFLGGIKPGLKSVE